MKILAFLQNQWFRDPEAARAAFARHPDRRNDLIRLYLFMGCLTGKRLRQVFGDLCEEIIWEECSTEIGGKSSTAFPPDLNHMRAAIAKHAPRVVLVFGSLAQGATSTIFREFPGLQFIYGPHPASRVGALAGLSVMRAHLVAFLEMNSES